jgi:hypothetical protein
MQRECFTRRSAHGEDTEVLSRHSVGGVVAVEVPRSEREQKTNSIRNGNPSIDERGTVRLIRRVEWTCC